MISVTCLHHEDRIILYSFEKVGRYEDTSFYMLWIFRYQVSKRAQILLKQSYIATANVLQVQYKNRLYASQTIQEQV